MKNNYYWHALSCILWAGLFVGVQAMPWYVTYPVGILVGTNVMFLLLFTWLPTYPLSMKPGNLTHLLIFIFLPILIVVALVLKVVEHA